MHLTRPCTPPPAPQTPRPVRIPPQPLPRPLSRDDEDTLVMRLRVTEASDSRRRLMAAIAAYDPQGATCRPGR